MIGTFLSFFNNYAWWKNDNWRHKRTKKEKEVQATSNMLPLFRSDVELIGLNHD